MARVPSDDLVHRSRHRRLAEADAELDRVAERLEAELRESHPELFDRRGRLRQRALSRLLLEQFGGKRVSGEELWALIPREDQPAPTHAADGGPAPAPRRRPAGIAARERRTRAP
jgi:hypothetical protein